MPETIRLKSMPVIASTKILAQVQAGKMTVTDYVQELARIGVTAMWTSQDQYVIEFGSGIKDPSGEMLSTEEVIEVCRMLTPAPHECAGKKVSVRGPMVGVAGVTIARICYAATVTVDTQAKGNPLPTTHVFEPTGRDKVRLRNPDTVESLRDAGGGWVICRTSQIWYRRHGQKPAFDVTGVLLSRVELSPKTQRYQASLFDPHTGHFAWCEDLNNLIAV